MLLWVLWIVPADRSDVSVLACILTESWVVHSLCLLVVVGHVRVSMGPLDWRDGLRVFISLSLLHWWDEVLVCLADFAVEAVALDLALWDLALGWEKVCLFIDVLLWYTLAKLWEILLWDALRVHLALSRDKTLAYGVPSWAESHIALPSVILLGWFDRRTPACRHLSIWLLGACDLLWCLITCMLGSSVLGWSDPDNFGGCSLIGVLNTLFWRVHITLDTRWVVSTNDLGWLNCLLSDSGVLDDVAVVTILVSIHMGCFVGWVDRAESFGGGLTIEILEPVVCSLGWTT